MAWLRAADTEVKRDMEISRDEVRVMTVHGAKGLEASVVFLVDTTSSPSDTQRLRLIHLPSGTGEVVVWAGRKADDPGRGRSRPRGDAGRDRGRISPPALCGDDARGRSPDHRRLHAGQHEQCPQALLVRPRSAEGLANSGLQEQTIESAGRPGEALFAGRGYDGTAARAAKPSRTGAAIELPAWLRTSVPAGDAGPRPPLRPSDSGGESRHGSARARPSRTAPARMQRGTLVHRLLQSLPDLATERRRDAALKFLARNATGWSEADRESLAEGVLGLIGDQRFAAVFADGSRAEVAIVGRLALAGRPPALVSGQIDRLVVTDGRGPDRRFQDQSGPAADGRRGAAGLRPPARALPGGPAQALSPTAGPRRAALDRNP